MSGIQVIVTFKIQPESSSQFSALMRQVRQDLPQVEGCKAVRAFTSHDDPGLFTLLEEWDSVAAHRAHLDAVVASGAWAALESHLAKAPVSCYLRELPAE